MFAFSFFFLFSAVIRSLVAARRHTNVYRYSSIPYYEFILFAVFTFSICFDNILAFSSLCVSVCVCTCVCSFCFCLVQFGCVRHLCFTVLRCVFCCCCCCGSLTRHIDYDDDTEQHSTGTVSFKGIARSLLCIC